MKEEPMSQPEIDPQILRSIQALQEEKPTVFVAIDGGGGAGKSTFANALVEQLGSDAKLIHIDDYYEKGHEDEPFTDTEPVYAHFDLERLKDEVLNNSTNEGIVVVEGIGTLGRTLRSYFDYKIWLEVPAEVRRERGLQRDGQDRANTWDNRDSPEDERYVVEQQPQAVADFIVRQ